MSNKSLTIAILVLLVVAGGVYFYQNKSFSPSPSSNSGTPTPSPSPTPSVSGQVNATIKTPISHSLSIQNFAFSQASLTVKKGDTVVWTNKDSAPHTVSGGAGGPSSGTLNTGGTYSFTFNSVGTFPYRCNFHPSMTGTVIVTN